MKDIEKPLVIAAAIATIIGTCIAIIALIPAFGQWLGPKAPEYNNPQSYVEPTKEIYITPPTESVNQNPPNSSSPNTALPSNNTSYATISCENDITQASLRNSPGYIGKDDSTDVLYKIDCGQTVQILGERRDVDGLTWWKISWNGYTGWMADHSGNGRTILVFN